MSDRPQTMLDRFAELRRAWSALGRSLREEISEHRTLFVLWLAAGLMILWWPW